MKLQLRDGDIPGTLIASGYLLELGDYRTLGGPTHEGWMERIERDAIFRALAERPSMRLLVDGFAVARTSDGTMKLFVDDLGLHMSATLVEAHPDVARINGNENLELKFTVTSDTWNFDRSRRVIDGISLNGYDVVITP